jgi:hypothetical protein
MAGQPVRQRRELLRRQNDHLVILDRWSALLCRHVLRHGILQGLRQHPMSVMDRPDGDATLPVLPTAFL